MNMIYQINPENETGISNIEFLKISLAYVPLLCIIVTLNSPVKNPPPTLIKVYLIYISQTPGDGINTICVLPGARVLPTKIMLPSI